ncbi:MAG: hypothetical protein AB1540_11255 [Bdellovibrionota bacterium]
MGLKSALFGAFLVLLVILLVPSRLYGFSADVVGAYNWGSYESGRQSTEAFSGPGLRGFGGYRFPFGLEMGAAASIDFPQVSGSSNSPESGFSRWAFGPQVGYLWQERLEPFAFYFPVNRLKQTLTTRTPGAKTETELAYEGQSYGGGVKLYLTKRRSDVAQVGFAFVYGREHYDKVMRKTRNSQGSSQEQRRDTVVLGTTYQMGVFIGI